MSVTSVLQLVNSVLEAAIVILISSVLLYGIQASVRNRVARASSLLLAFTVVAYLGDLFLTQTASLQDMERWLRAEWIGISFVPSAYLQLSHALAESSGSTRRRVWRRLAVTAGYCLSAIALALAAFSDTVVQHEVVNINAPQLRPGPAFPIFALLFGGLIGLGLTFQFQARQRSRTVTMRRRITFIIASAGGPVVSVFPYLLITGQSSVVPAPFFWGAQVVGNAVVGVTIFFMTYSVAYFGVNEPDRVVRLRLIKFLARGPLVAIGVLALLVFVGRAGRFLGLSSDRATPFVVVAGIVILQWIILLIKPSLERWFYFDEREQVVRIQELHDRILTTQDLHQFLENILASVCDLLQVETAFVASYGVDGAAKVEVIVGELALDSGENARETWQSLKLDERAGPQLQQERFSWDGYWIVRLYDRARQNVLGILGTEAPRIPLEPSADKGDRLSTLLDLAATALEDQLLQQEVFAAMEGLLQKVTAAQRQRQALAGASGPLRGGEVIVGQDGYVAMVRDALSHYWGGPKLTQSPLLRLQIVRQGISDHQGSSINAMRAVLQRAVESVRPEGERNLTTSEWILYNILELKFLRGYRVRDIARRLAMSESDLYRKQRVAIEAVASAIAEMEHAAQQAATESSSLQQGHDPEKDRVA